MRSDRGKMQASKNDTKIPPADDPTKSSKSGEVELDDKALEWISGGTGNQWIDPNRGPPKHMAGVKYEDVGK